MTVRPCFRGLNRNPVLAKDVYRRAGDRFPRLDGNEEDVASSTGAFFGENSKVSNEQKAAVFDIANRLLFSRIPAARAQEEEPALASAVRRFLQLLGKIERGIICFPFILERDRLVFDPDPGNIFLIEQMRIFELRI